MSSALRSAVVFALVSAFAVLIVPGCSQQGEGERCDSAKNGDEDCDSSLICVRSTDLVDRTTDRCCPAALGAESDKRCIRGVASESEPTAGTSSGGTSGGGTSGGGTSSGGAESGGAESGGAESGGAAGATGAESTGGGDTAGAGGAG
jgi:hypothetical protein